MTEEQQFLEQLRKPIVVYSCARLNTGELVVLPKDCGCITHEGPHWLDYDRTIKKINNDIILNQGRVTMLGIMGYQQEERARLNELLFQFKKHNIAKLLTLEEYNQLIHEAQASQHTKVDGESPPSS